MQNINSVWVGKPSSKLKKRKKINPQVRFHGSFRTKRIKLKREAQLIYLSKEALTNKEFKGISLVTGNAGKHGVVPSPIRDLL